MPFDSISVEMVFRGIYHFTQALDRVSTLNLTAYLAAPKNRDLGIVKSPRPKRAKPPLDLIYLLSPLDNWLICLTCPPMPNTFLVLLCIAAMS